MTKTSIFPWVWALAWEIMARRIARERITGMRVGFFEAFSIQTYGMGRIALSFMA